MNKTIKLLLVIASIVASLLAVSLRLENRHLTETELLVKYWWQFLLLSFAVIPGIWVLRR
jgi:predicted CDP-diglyceride synthetase/phosphatidate cytidylyltransferase